MGIFYACLQISLFFSESTFSGVFQLSSVNPRSGNFYSHMVWLQPQYKLCFADILKMPLQFKTPNLNFTCFRRNTCIVIRQFRNSKHRKHATVPKQCRINYGARRAPAPGPLRLRALNMKNRQDVKVIWNVASPSPLATETRAASPETFVNPSRRRMNSSDLWTASDTRLASPSSQIHRFSHFGRAEMLCFTVLFNGYMLPSCPFLWGFWNLI